MLQQTCESLDKEQIPKGIFKMSNIYIKGISCLKYNSKVQVAKMPKVNSFSILILHVDHSSMCVACS